MEPFLVNALAAGIGMAMTAAPLGCFVVWRRMAYFGETIAHASLIGIAVGLALRLENQTGATLAVGLLVALALVGLSRQRLVPVDTLLGFMAHAALAYGVIATSMVGGPAVDLSGYLFGDIFAVSTMDLVWIFGGGAFVLAVLALIWKPLLAVAVHDEIAIAEGVKSERLKLVFVLILAIVIAVAMKIVGVLLAVAFLIMPAAAARPLSNSPEQMALLAGLIASISVAAGLALSLALDTPGGPSIVAVLAALAGTSITLTAVRAKGR